MFGWLDSAAHLLSPLATILNFVGVLIGIPVAVWRTRKWLIGIQQHASSAATSAGAAEKASLNAAGSANAANEQAGAARDNSRQANEAIAWLASELGKSNRRADSVAYKADTFLAALLQQRVRHPEDFDDPTDEDPAPAPDEPIITGRHRLPTTAVPITTEQDIQ